MVPEAPLAEPAPVPGTLVNMRTTSSPVFAGVADAVLDAVEA